MLLLMYLGICGYVVYCWYVWSYFFKKFDGEAIGLLISLALSFLPMVLILQILEWMGK